MYDKLPEYVINGQRDLIIFALMKKAKFLAFRYSQSYTDQRDDLEGVALLALVESVEHLKPGFSVGQIVTFVSNVIRNTLLAYLKKEFHLTKREIVTQDGRLMKYVFEDITEVEISVSPLIFDQVYFEEILTRLKLSVLERQVVLARVADYSYADITEETGLSQAKIHALLKRVQRRYQNDRP
jgi:RNA polymerase sigma factor (sigma-70 family)